MKYLVFGFILAFAFVQAADELAEPNWNKNFYVVAASNSEKCCLPKVNTRVNFVEGEDKTVLYVNAVYPENDVCKKLFEKGVVNGKVVVPWTASSTADPSIYYTEEKISGFKYRWNLGTADKTSRPSIDKGIDIDPKSIWGYIRVDQQSQGGDSCQYYVMKSSSILTISFVGVMSFLLAFLF